MNYYIEVTLLPGADIDLHYLWSKVYQQVHLALVENQDKDGNVPVGIAFPEYNEKKYQLGTKIRLFATEESVLDKLDIKKWIKRLNDYVHCTQVRSVPDNIKQLAMYRRKQANRSQSKIKRTIKRQAEREGISIEEAGLKLKNSLNKTENNISDMKLLKQPYINMSSLSSGERFRLFIDKKTGLTEPVSENFNAYGLSHKSTVPEF